MEGFAPRYAPHLMERVAERRGMDVGGCLISSAYYPIATHLWVYGRNTRVLRLCTVVDVSSEKDRARHHRTGRIIELSHSAALSLCGNLGRPDECGVIVFFVGDSE